MICAPSAVRCFQSFTQLARTPVLAATLALVGCGSTSQALFQPAAGEGGEGGAESGPSSSAGASQAGNAGEGSASAADDALLYDPNHLLEVAITVDASDWDTMRKQSRGLDTLLGADCQSQPFASPFTYVHANVTIDGQSRADVGLRKKGFLGSLDEDKPSLKISLDEYSDQELFGSHDITLNNGKQDPSYLNQCLGYSTFAAAGVPASRCNFAHVTVNGQDLGLYVHVESIKKPMLRRHFASDDGNLYEGTLSDFREGWLGTFEKKTNESDPTRPELDALTAALAVPDAELVQSLGEVLNLDEFVSLWAVEVLLQHWDGYAGNQNNFYLYGEPTSGKVLFLPWGIDQLFGGAAAGNGTPEAILTTGAIAHRLYATAEGRQLFDARLREILDSVWKVPELTADIDRMLALVSPVLTPGDRLAQGLAVAGLKARVAARKAALTAALAAAPSELPALRGLVCFREVGSISGTFATTWGTAGAENPLLVGDATLDAVVNGEAWVIAPDSIGAVAGPGDDPNSAFPESLGIPALRDDGMLGILYFGLKPEQVKPGDVLLGPGTGPSLLLELDPAVKDAPATVLATAFGTLHFDAAATTPGAPLKGSYQGTLYASGLLGTQ